MKRPSQNARILELLSGGDWIDHHRLYEIGCVAHSRIAELRARGHEIEQRRVTVGGKPVWEYRLAGEVEEGAARPGECSSVSGTSAPSSTSSFPYLGADTTEQLTLDSAA